MDALNSTTAPKKLRWGVMSFANIAKTSVSPALLNTENAVLEAVAGRSPEKKEGFLLFAPQKFYDNYEALLNDPQVDAVYIPLPNSLHYEWTIQALRHKKHVLCEKPLAMTYHEAKEMFDAAEENGVLLMEAFAYLHGEEMKLIREVLDSGVLGKIRHVDVRFIGTHADPKNIRYDPALGGGALYDLGCYSISFIRRVLGKEPEDISASLGVGKLSGVDEFDLVSMSFENGAVTANTFVSLSCRTDCSRTIVGETGILILNSFFNSKGEITAILKKPQGVDKLSVFCPDPYQLEIENFTNAVLNGSPLLLDRDFSLENARVIERIMNEGTKR